MKAGYSKKVMDLFLNPKNVGAMEDADITAIAGSVACGDMIKLYIKMDGERIKKITFESYGCAANIATSSMVTEMVKGKSIDYALKITLQDELKELGGLPKVKYHCAILAIKALRLAIEKWNVMNGKRKLDEDFVKELLGAILDPYTGKNITAAGIIKEIKIDGKEIKIYVRLGDNKEFNDEIVSGIEEVFEKMDVEVKINAV
ncbi:MAG: DUF59 domain-containing protein [Thermoplasmata archaeon]|nr:MAG: DUF59 domain-containing protein [Thermoplasmata archaeon]MCD6573758.1 iron-sulfur cluster assembly scaffold protein [Thermoplasmata archaeon]